MKIIDAVWEKRNLGMDTVEFELSGEESLDQIKEALKKNEKQYNVVKVPYYSYDTFKLLSEFGYVYSENLFHLTHNLRLNLSPIQKRISDSITYSLMDESDIAQLNSEINKQMFSTDRIALNPSFGIKTSNIRYMNWISDEIQKGTDIYKMIYKDQSVGFFGYKKVAEDVYFPFLAGMYKDYISSGLGIGIVTKPIEESQRRKAKMNSTYVSSNNSNTLTLHISLGFQIKDVNCVFSKINN